MTYKYNAEVDVGEYKDKKERARWGLSHQLYFDLQLMIEGTLGLLHDQIERWGSVCLKLRRLSQDSLESLFGAIRYACGGGNHPQLLTVAQAAKRCEEKAEDKHRVNLQRKRKQNSGAVDEAPTKMAKMPSWQKGRMNKKRTATAAVLEQVRGAREVKARWHMHEPVGFKASMRQHLQPGAQPAIAHAVDWHVHVYKAIQHWDATTNAGARMFHRLTPAHFERTAHSRMNLGIAIDIFRPEHARGLRMLRALYA
jgi:hypothetical protein